MKEQLITGALALTALGWLIWRSFRRKKKKDHNCNC